VWFLSCFRTSPLFLQRQTRNLPSKGSGFLWSTWIIQRRTNWSPFLAIGGCSGSPVFMSSNQAKADIFWRPYKLVTVRIVRCWLLCFGTRSICLRQGGKSSEILQTCQVWGSDYFVRLPRRHRVKNGREWSSWQDRRSRRLQRHPKGRNPVAHSVPGRMKRHCQKKHPPDAPKHSRHLHRSNCARVFSPKISMRPMPT